MKGIKGFQKGHGFFGYKNPEERARKISRAKTGRRRNDIAGDNNPMRRPEVVAKMSGRNHHAWIKDRTKVKRFDQRDNPEYQRWRRAVKKRDGYKCQVRSEECAGSLEVHHILNWEDHASIRYDTSNGITLCHFHHPRGEESEKRMASQFRMIVDRQWARRTL